jgi:hypothetical protein
MTRRVRAYCGFVVAISGATSSFSCTQRDDARASRNDPTSRLASARPASEQPATSAAPALIFVEPKSVAIVEPGQNIAVTVEFPRGFVPKDGILINLGDDARNVVGPPYTTTFVVPDKSGHTQISAIAFDAERKPAAAICDLTVSTQSPVNEISFSANQLIIFMFHPTGQLKLLAHHVSGRLVESDPSLEVAYRMR